MSVDHAELHRRWRALVRCFPLWRMPLDLIAPSSWNVFGADLASMAATNRHARRAARDLQTASPEMLDALATMSQVNVARTGEFFRIVMLTYVSIPLAFAALLSDAAPEMLRAELSRQAPSITIFLAGAIIFPLLYLGTSWRAKQMDWTIQLFRGGAVQPADGMP